MPKGAVTNQAISHIDEIDKLIGGDEEQGKIIGSIDFGKGGIH